MAEYSKLYITNNGQALMAKMIAGSGNIDFTKVCSSSTQYTESQLQALTALSNIKQTTFGGGLMESITMQMQPQVNVIPMLQIMVLLMTVRQHLMKIQECVQSMETVIFPLSVIQKILIGCSYRVSSTETPPFLLVIIVGIRTVLVGVSLDWVLVGIVACLPVLSVGFWLMLLLIVIGISAVGWCIEKR